MSTKITSSPGAVSRPAAWMTFAWERFQIPAILVVALAQATSAQYIVSSTLDWSGLVISVVGIAALAIIMRMMDELKDLDKDRLAHPTRPLPRGLISPQEVRSGLWIGIGLLLVASVSIGVLRNPLAGVLIGLCVGYSVLMYHEFFAPDLLGVRPFSYAATHQIIIVPIYAFATATALPEATLTQPVLWFALTGLGASFALEVCRKLDPEAHPVLGTYLSVAGPGRTATSVVIAVGLAAYAGYRIGIHIILWPVALVLLASLGLTLSRPASFKWTAGFAGFFLLAQVLGPTINHFTGASP